MSTPRLRDHQVSTSTSPQDSPRPTSTQPFSDAISLEVATLNKSNQKTELNNEVPLFTSSSTKQKCFLTAVTLLYFVFMTFFGGLQIGYGSLVMTFAVKFLGWSEDDGNNVIVLLQVASVVMNGVAAATSRCVKPQVLLFSYWLSIKHKAVHNWRLVVHVIFYCRTSDYYLDFWLIGKRLIYSII